MVRRHKPGDFMAGYRIARAFLSGWTYVRVTLLSGWTDVRVDRCPGNFVPPWRSSLSEREVTMGVSLYARVG